LETVLREHTSDVVPKVGRLGWALREETKKAYRLNNKKVCLEKRFDIGQSSRRKVDADAVPETEISRIASFR